MKQIHETVTIPINQAPSVYTFLDYRKYLRAYYEYKISLNPRFSFQVFSRLIGVKGASYVRLIVSGKRNLSAENIEGIARACHLESGEKEFFYNLVHWNQSTNPIERDAFWAELVRLAPQDDQFLISSSEAQILTKWYVIPLLEFVSIKGFKMDFDWITTQCLPFLNLTKEQIRNTYQFLLDLGLIQKNGSTYEKTNKILFARTKDYGELAKSYYSQVIPKGAEALLQIPAEFREFSALTMSLRDQDLAILKKDIQEFYKNVLSYAAEVNDPEEVYQLTVQLYPIFKN